MRAAVMTEPCHPLSVEEVTVLDPGPGEVLVRVTAAGVCHSDLSVLNGVVPMGTQVLGHEGAGVVEAVGRDVTGLQVGHVVIGSSLPACGKCWYCLRGQSYVCAETNVMFIPHYRRNNGDTIPGLSGLGTFSEMMTVSQYSIVRVETDLPAEILALIGCAVTTGVGAALFTARVEPGSTVAVIGCGGVGQAIVQGAQIAGAAKVIAVDPVPFKRKIALQFGATDVLDPNDVDTVASIIELTSGRGADYVFEAAGTVTTLRQTVEATRPGGAAVMVGMPDVPDVSVPAMALLTGRHLLGCAYGQANVRRDFGLFVDLIEAGRLDVGAMVSRTMRLEDVNVAFDALRKGEVIRTVLLMD